MRILRTAQQSQVAGAHARRGAALMLAILVLFALIMIVFQISMNAGTDRRIARNDRQLTNFDLAIESMLLQVYEDLAEDAAASQEADSGADAGGGGFPPLPGAEGDTGGASGPTDSRKDTWARPQRTEINGVALRILIQDENSKLNVLTMLTEDKDEADKAFDRVVRVLDLCRESTTEDIDGGEARDMAESMRDFLQSRENAVLPVPSLLTDEDSENDYGMPLTLREFVVLDGFQGKHFRDYRDSDGAVVHSIASFLTISTSLSTYQEFRDDIQEASQQTGANVGVADSGGTAESDDGADPAEGDASADGGFDPATGNAALSGGDGNAGYAVNVNTAPNAVLHAIMDRNEISWTFLDDLIAYRNEEEEADPGLEETDPVYDEYGEEVVDRKIFDSLDELEEVYSWDTNEPALRDEFMNHLTVESSVFSIFVTARFSTNSDKDSQGDMSREALEEAEEMGTDLTRTVRCLVWRYQDGEDYVLVPLERWEVLDYRPYEVLDYPEEER